MVSSLKPVERPRALSDQAYQVLRANVRNGKILPGQALQAHLSEAKQAFIAATGLGRPAAKISGHS